MTNNKFLIPLFAVLVSTLGVPVLEQQRVDLDQNSRIIGGSKAPEGAFPYMVSLRYNGNHGCCGSIIDNTTILTAGHCLSGVSPSRLTIVVGSNTLDSGGTTYPASSIRIHEGFKKLRRDIGIIKLSSAIEYSSTVRPIELETSDVAGGVDAVLSGWGMTSYPGPFSNDLHYVDLKTISNTECKRHLPIFIRDANICTLTKKGEGACKGDSGAPLVSNGVQIGIDSWSLPCAIGSPDAYTRVSYYIDWINANK